MSALDEAIEDLVAASRILAAEGICDAFGHVSARHPDRPDCYLLSRAIAPELVGPDDIMTFALDGTPLDGDACKPFLERYIHGGLYERRPDVGSVVHSHSRSVIPFTITPVPLRPVLHSAAVIGHELPVWEARENFGDTNLLIADMAMGRDFADTVGAGRGALMRGHGSTVVGRTIREAVYTAVYLEVNALLQFQASQMGPINFLSAGEIEIIQSRLADAKPGEGYDRAWSYWRRRAGL